MFLINCLIQLYLKYFGWKKIGFVKQSIDDILEFVKICIVLKNNLILQMLGWRDIFCWF